ncbi:MAG: hypothetical protein Q7R30_02230 [Acidobacteriota bacterium]|nr:hypothetical protein [Acidobacteriota bacterium]
MAADLSRTRRCAPRRDFWHAYHFEGDCLQNTVFDITEVSPDLIVGDGAAFTERHRQHGWPAGWDPRNETPQQFFGRLGTKLFELGSSHSMTGWVAAASMEQVVMKEKRG